MATMATTDFRDKMPWDALEDYVNKMGERYHSQRRAKLNRCGVQASKKRVEGPPGQGPRYEWQVHRSRPDFEGLLPGGFAFYFDCKVVSGSSFPLSEYHSESKGEKRRQLQYMLDRASYGAKCFFLIHWNRRELQTKVEPNITYAFPVHPRMPFWAGFDRKEVKSITRKDCDELGKLVQWVLASEKSRSLLPEFLAVL